MVLPTSALSDSAAAAALICGDTGEILYSHGGNQPLPMASTTKIMTALLLCETGELDKTLTVTEEMVRVEGSSMGLLPQDTVSYRDLLYGMMLASGNDAATVTAYALGGSLSGFADRMNHRAQSMGLKNTHFVTPSGLDDQNHYTTALDLAFLAREALKNDEFAAACASQKATLSYGNPPYQRSLTNHNRLLKTFDGLIGVKTGFTKRAGRCLVTAAKRDGRYVIAVTLNDPNDWQDHEQLLNFGLSVVQSKTLSWQEQPSELAVVGGTKLTGRLKNDSFSFCAATPDGVKQSVFLPSFVYAPIQKDQPVGKVLYLSEDRVMGETTVFADETVSANKSTLLQRYLAQILCILKKL